MKAIIACLLIASTVLGIHDTIQPSIPSMSSGLSMAEMNKIEELKKTKWGGIFMTMAEMQLTAGPIERLIQALDDMAKELDKSLTEENTRFKQKQATHEANVLNLNNQINAANSEVASAKLRIQNVLLKQKKQAENEIARDTKTVKKKEKQIQSAKDTRKKAKSAFEDRVTEHNKAIAAADECIKLTQGLLSGQSSLVEIKKATMSIRRLELKLRQTHETETPLIEALISLVSSQNFANQQSTNKVFSLLNEFRGRLARSLETEKSDEEKSIAAHKAILKQLRAEITDLKNQIRSNTKVVEVTIKDIDAANNVITVKSQEVLSLKEKLDVENDAWRKESDTHKDLVDEILKEIDVVKQCRTLFANSKFSRYASKKMGK